MLGQEEKQHKENKRYDLRKEIRRKTKKDTETGSNNTEKTRYSKTTKEYSTRNREKCTKTCWQPDDKEVKQFWSKISEWRDHARETEWMYNMEKERLFRPH